MFEKILIANRGEIACRIIRTAKKLGIKTVAVYSDADAKALHVKMADEAFHLGASPSKKSYLKGNAIIAIAKKTGAEAIHPGYGFLSENAEFAALCEKEKICFIGPPASAIRAMGSKSAAKQLMEKANVLFIPGYHGDDQNIETLKNAAHQIGFPVLLKAAAGGGGKGMRIVRHENELEQALTSAKREAMASFNDDKMLIEKYLTHPRHIEIQIFADQHGNAIHLFERDCSIQRRQQKIIEEAPAPHFSNSLREKMGQAAILAAKAIHYVGAGTVEFLVDNHENFYFMEMNTRLQVEHTITEMITQQDLVEWQIKVALGEKLPLTQAQIQINGHSFEARIYAEDPRHDFLPSIGEIIYLHKPKENQHIRIDMGIQQNDTVSMYYDPMIAKLIVWDYDRQSALQKLHSALSEFHVIGVLTNLQLLKNIAHYPAFEEGKINTHFIQEHESVLLAEPAQPSNEIFGIASLFLLLQQTAQKQEAANKVGEMNSPWYRNDSFELNFKRQQVLKFLDPKQVAFDIKANIQENIIQLQFPDKTFLQLQGTLLDKHTLEIMMNEKKITATIFLIHHSLHLLTDNHYTISISTSSSENDFDSLAASHVNAPMPGKVVALFAKAGDKVERGSGLIVIEAMKMEHTVYAPISGTIKECYFAVGDMVNEGQALLEFSEES